MTDITAMAAGRTQRPFDPGISSEDKSLVNDWNKMLNKAEVIQSFIVKLIVKLYAR